MTNVAWDEQGVDAQRTTVGEAVSAEAPMGEERMSLSRWQAALVALGGLIFVYGVALGSMYAFGSLAQFIDPGHHLDILYIFHNRIVVFVLIGISALWLLPPYPSAMRAMEVTRSPNSPSQASGDGEPSIAVLAHAQWSDGRPARGREAGCRQSVRDHGRNPGTRPEVSPVSQSHMEVSGRELSEDQEEGNGRWSGRWHGDRRGRDRRGVRRGKWWYPWRCRDDSGHGTGCHLHNSFRAIGSRPHPDPDVPRHKPEHICRQSHSSEG